MQNTVKSTYDEEKHKLSDAYYDLDGNPIIIAKGYASISYGYKKHITEEDFDFSKIKKHPEFGKRILKLYQNHGHCFAAYNP